MAMAKDRHITMLEKNSRDDKPVRASAAPTCLSFNLNKESEKTFLVN